MQIGIPKETAAGEKRVATVPDVVEKLVKLVPAPAEAAARDYYERHKDLFVEPEARGVGVGSALMTELLDAARRNGSCGIEAEALPGDRATKNFFEGFGLVARKITVHRRLDDRGDPGG